MKLEFTRQIFEKYSNIKFNENPSSRSRVVPCWRTDRNYEANNRLRNFGDVSNEMTENVNEKKMPSDFYRWQYMLNKSSLTL